MCHYFTRNSIAAEPKTRITVCSKDASTQGYTRQKRESGTPLAIMSKLKTHYKKRGLGSLSGTWNETCFKLRSGMGFLSGMKYNMLFFPELLYFIFAHPRTRKKVEYLASFFVFL